MQRTDKFDSCNFAEVFQHFVIQHTQNCNFNLTPLPRFFLAFTINFTLTHLSFFPVLLDGKKKKLHTKAIIKKEFPYIA